MQTLLHYAKKLEPVPERFLALDRAEFTVPECQTRVDLFPELRDGKLYFYADLNPRQSPTIAAFLAILFSAINGHPPETTLGIPSDFVRHDDGRHRARWTRGRTQRDAHAHQAPRPGRDGPADAPLLLSST